MSFWKFLNEEKTKRNSCLLHLKRRKTKRAGGRCSELSFHFLEREREREHLLSRFPSNPTFEILRSKKQSCSTRRGQRVGTGFLEFQQTP